MQKSRLALVLAFTAAAATAARAQTQIPKGLESKDPAIREQAFFTLVNPADAHGGRDDAIALALIRLLETENAYVATHKALPEDYGDSYYLYVVSAVVGLHDSRAARALVGSISNGWVVTNALTEMGDAAVPELVLGLTRAPISHRRDIALTLGDIASRRESLRVSDRAMREMRGPLLKAAQGSADNLRLRAAAIQALMAFDGEDIAETMRRVYETDSQQGARDGERVTYPARDLARQWLEKHNRRP